MRRGDGGDGCRGGTRASVWVAEPVSAAQGRALVTQLTSAVANEYRALIDEAHSAQTEDEPTKSRILARLRRELRRIGERAYFPPPERQEAREAIEALATTMEAPE